MKKQTLTSRLIFILFASAFLAPGMNAIENWPSQVRFGVVPDGDQKDVLSKWRPLTLHLEKRLGIRVIPVTGPDYGRIIDLISAKKIDFAYFGPNL